MTWQTAPKEKDKWAAQRQELTRLQGQLADVLPQLMEEAVWMTWLRVARHFHTYSLNKLTLFAAQNPSSPSHVRPRRMPLDDLSPKVAQQILRFGAIEHQTERKRNTA